jgi:RNA polymerase sigma factor for flagellar operon FliA
MVRSMAWLIHQRVRGRVDLNDLIGYGQVGLAEAAAKYDAATGNRFSTYAYHRIRGAILDGLSRMEWFRYADFYRDRYAKLAHEVLDEHSGSVDSADSLDVKSNSAWLSDVSVRLSVVYLASDLADDAERVPQIEDGRVETPSKQFALAELRGAVRRQLEELPEQGRRLMHWIYFDGLTLTAAAERLGIGKSWASRLHDRMLRTLANGLRERGLDATG